MIQSPIHAPGAIYSDYQARFMSRFRKDRVSELIREVISDIILFKVKDPRVQGITITEVQMAADLKSARVYFSSLADGKAQMHQEGLQAAEKFIRHQLRAELDLKYIPTLSFSYDESFDNFARINRLLRGIEEPES